MTYGAVNTVTTADAEHTWEAISDVSNVGLLNWERQSLTCHFFSKYSPLYNGCILYIFDVVSLT